MFSYYKQGASSQAVVPAFMGYRVGSIFSTDPVTEHLLKYFRTQTENLLKAVATGAADKETRLIIAGNALAAMALNHAAYFNELCEYNKQAKALHENNLRFYALLKANDINVPPVPPPKLFRVLVSNGVEILAFTRQPKGKEPICSYEVVTYPSVFIEQDALMDPDTGEDIKISGSPAEIGIAPVIAVWAIRIVFVIVAAVAAIFVLMKLKDLIYGAAAIQQEYNKWAGEQQIKEVQEVSKCVQAGIEAAKERGEDPGPWIELRQACDRSIEQHRKPGVGKPEAKSLGTTALYLAVAAGIVLIALAALF